MDSGVQYYWQTMPCNKKLGYVCHKAATVPTQAEGTWISSYVTICVSFLGGIRNFYSNNVQIYFIEWKKQNITDDSNT